MKHIKKFAIYEMAMGVPEGNIEIAAETYKHILKLDKMDLEELLQHGNVTTTMRGKFNISDFKFNKIKIKLEVIRYDIDKIEFAGMTFIASNKLDTIRFKQIHNVNTDKVSLIIKMVIPKELDDINEIENFLIDNKDELLSSLAHEFKHSYDYTKLDSTPFKHTADYRSSVETRFGIEAIDKFLYYLYFINGTENLVRPTEFLSLIKSRDIKKEDFLGFLKDNDTYKHLKSITELSYEKMRSDLLKDTDLIRTRLRDSDIDEIPENDEELVDFILLLTYRNLFNAKYDIIGDMVFSTPFGSINNKLKYMSKFERKMKSDNFKDFFEREIKRLNFVSNNIIKKISKLYDMAKDVKVDTLMDKISKKSKIKTESIHNWELWQDIHGIKPKIKKL